MINGIVVVDKPSGITSHDVVSRVRRKFHMRRVGHAGTLDPLATGVLIILLGKSTKLFNEFVAFDKGYHATLQLGVRTDTADIEGRILERLPYEHIGEEKFLEILPQFTGEIQQIPPMVSAVKFKGQRLYKLARKGLEVEREPRTIQITSLKLLNFSSPHVQFAIECSKGTYVRKVAEDIGESLGCGACISQIQRTKVGPFDLDGAVRLDDLNVSHVQKWPENHESYLRN